MSTIESKPCLLLQLSNGGTTIVKSSADNVDRFCADITAGKPFATLVDADGDTSYYAARYLYAVSPISQQRYDELQDEMEKQNLAARMRIPPGMKMVPGARS